MSRVTETHGGGLLSVAAPAPLALSPGEAKLLAVFRAMDKRAKSDVLEFASRLAELNPHREAPSLRLVVGGAK